MGVAAIIQDVVNISYGFPLFGEGVEEPGAIIPIANPVSLSLLPE